MDSTSYPASHALANQRDCHVVRTSLLAMTQEGEKPKALRLTSFVIDVHRGFDRLSVHLRALPAPLEQQENECGLDQEETPAAPARSR